MLLKVLVLYIQRTEIFGSCMSFQDNICFLYAAYTLTVVVYK